MKHLSLIASALAVLGLTVCEKGLEDETAVSPTGQVGNSVYAVGGASAEDYVLPSADEATVTSAIALRGGNTILR